MKRSDAVSTESAVLEVIEQFNAVKDGLESLRKECETLKMAYMTAQEYYLILLLGSYSNSPEYFLIPIESITIDQHALIIFASNAQDPECESFYCVDQVIFPEDSQEEKKRKSKLQKEHKWIQLMSTDGRHRDSYAKSYQEAKRNEENFDKACALFYTFGENGKKEKGVLYKFKTVENEVSGKIRKVYSWKNVL